MVPTLVVNSFLDTPAVNLVSGMDASSQASLRSAIQAADYLGGDQTIQFDPSVFAAPRTITLTLGLLDQNDGGIYNNASLQLVDCVIAGNTADSAGAGIDNSPNGTAGLTACTVTQNDLVSNGYGVAGAGGGICNSGTASLPNCHGL